jgi:predicted CXXCH cytochrome family protein
MRTHNFIGGTMRRYIEGALVVAIGLCVASYAMAYTGLYTPGAGIKDTVHDLAQPGNGMGIYNVVDNAPDGTPLNRVCIFCHAPHNTYRLSSVAIGSGPQATDSAFDYLPLWNHELQANIGYLMYDNGPGAPLGVTKASQAIANGMVPGSTSLLCLSCHDGTVAANSYGNGASGGTQVISPGYVIGKDKYLGNHHPIGFNYDLVVAGDPAVNPSEEGIRDADATFLTTTTLIRDHLSAGTNMECATCHSVHNTGNSGERLLWRSDQNSELCLTCHAKGAYVAP